MKQELPWACKCICNYAFVISPSSSSSFFFLVSCLFPSSISSGSAQPGPVTGRETADECKAGFIHLCQGGVAEAMRAAGADVVHLLKI